VASLKSIQEWHRFPNVLFVCIHGKAIMGRSQETATSRRVLGMRRFAHVPGTLYRIMEGVRRAKAAHMLAHSQIRAEVIDRNGQSLGEAELPLDTLRSPKALIRRVTPADKRRWDRVVAGAKQSVLPYPPISVEPCSELGTKIEDIGFDFGGNP